MMQLHDVTLCIARCERGSSRNSVSRIADEFPTIITSELTSRAKNYSDDGDDNDLDARFEDWKLPPLLWIHLTNGQMSSSRRRLG